MEDLSKRYYQVDIPEWVSDDNIYLYLQLAWGEISENEFWEKYED